VLLFQFQGLYIPLHYSLTQHTPTPLNQPTPKTNHTSQSLSTPQNIPAFQKHPTSPKYYSPPQNNSNKTNKLPPATAIAGGFSLPSLPHSQSIPASQDHPTAKSNIYGFEETLYALRAHNNPVSKRPYLPLRGFNKLDFHRSPNCLIETTKHINKKLKWLAEEFSAFYDFYQKQGFFNIGY
jgi:hypothetical protein